MRRPASSRGRTRPAWPRCQAARRIGLAVFERDVPLPDALIEIEDAQGRVLVRGIEVASSSYTRAQVRAKRLAGFRLYSVPGFRRQERQRRIGTFVNGRFGLTETGQVVDHKM